jgi:ubiquinone/menaquinone biosynthesis C-methylase UbiE
VLKKSNLSIILRNLGLMHIVDRSRYQYFKWKNREKNKTFLRANPNVLLPSDYLIYESFQLDYSEYYTKSRETAKWLLNYFSKHVELKNVKILDWGCGPGRIIRHMPELIDDSADIYGTDYNFKSISWCQKNLTGISFNHNSIEAKLPYKNDYFNIIYGISIFTHLSEEMHYKWFDELYRVLKPGGILFVTTHGNVFITKLTNVEQAIFMKGELVVRGKVKEGHRTFTAYHPKAFMDKLFSGMQLLEHVVGSSNGKPQQDIWIVKKVLPG